MTFIPSYAIDAVDALLLEFNAGLHQIFAELGSTYHCRVNHTTYLVAGKLDAVRRAFKRRSPQLSIRITQQEYAYCTTVSVRHLDSYYCLNALGEMTQRQNPLREDMVRMCPPEAVGLELLAELRRRKLRLLLPA